MVRGLAIRPRCQSWEKFFGTLENQFVPDQAGPLAPCLGSNHYRCTPVARRSFSEEDISVTVVPETETMHDIWQPSDVGFESHGAILSAIQRQN
jgi:hypothetical protein